MTWIRSTGSVRLFGIGCTGKGWRHLSSAAAPGLRRLRHYRRSGRCSWGGLLRWLLWFLRWLLLWLLSLLRLWRLWCATDGLACGGQTSRVALLPPLVRQGFLLAFPHLGRRWLGPRVT